jgi:hypothetical protein
MKRWVKCSLIVVLALLLLIGAGAGALIYFAGQKGSSTIEKWISSQLQTIANSYLNPKLSFDDLDYQYPGTVKLKNLRLTANDPRHPGKTIDILGTEGATVVLGEVPSVGKPIVIQKITLNKPLFQAIATGPGEKTFVGFSGLVKQGVVKAATQPASPTRTKLSEVFQMRLVELIDGKIVYDPQIVGTQPMVLDEINTRLDVIPGDAGDYTVKVGFNRKPVFGLDVGMKLNLDTMYASDVKINLTASLSSANHSYLPPQVQKVLAEHEVRGELAVRVRGELPLNDYQKGDVLATIELTDANMRLGEYRLPCDEFVLQTKLKDNKVLLPVLRINALHGQLTAGGEVTLNNQLDSTMALQVADMKIDELFVNPDDPNNPKLAGRLNVGINTVVPLASLLPRLGKPDPSKPPITAPPLPPKWGQGEMHLDKARLVKIPILGDIIGLLSGGKKSNARTESVDLKFTFRGDKMHLSDLFYRGDFLAARGNGYIYLDHRLDLVVSGGPLEKAESLLGKTIGGAIGKVSDQLLTYLVTGTTDAPKYTPQVAGVVGKIGGEAVDTIGEGAKDVGKGAGDLFKGIFQKK